MVDPDNPKDTFIAVVEPEKFQKIEVTWKGDIGSPLTEIKLKGAHEGIFKETSTVQTVNIILLQA